MRIAVSCLTGVVAVLFLAARWFPSGSSTATACGYVTHAHKQLQNAVKQAIRKELTRPRPWYWATVRLNECPKKKTPCPILGVLPNQRVECNVLK